ncbi:sensor histidine kinase [Streptomyces graminilatus]|uniref:sensor histidine kinase n=1 Tax=Streptomyces graminilatus TaxID=1464070 RepID=UPI0006E3BA1D|nr:HAMP domain-containing sensor histidine kinase [Streptomyces graminilatus]
MPTDAGAAPRRRSGHGFGLGLGRALKYLPRRISRGFLVATTVSVLATEIYCALTLSYRLQERTDQQVSRNHDRRMEALRAGRGLLPTADGCGAVLLDERGGLRSWAGDSSITRQLSLPVAELRAWADGGGPRTVTGRPLRVRVGRLPDDSYLVTARSTAADRMAVRTLAGVQAVITLPLISLLALGAWWSSRRALAPLRDLALSARSIAEGSEEPTGRVAVPTRPASELQSAVETFNYLLRRIEEGSARRRSSAHGLVDLVGAASHELRTPLTTITGYAQLARLGALEDPGRLEQAMEHVHQETLRMASLVEDLLLLARLSQGGVLGQHPVDLAQLCIRAVEGAQSDGSRRTLRCVVERPCHLVEGDQQRLEQTVGNLLSNVLAHTPEDTSGEIRLRLVGDWHVIDVIDDGPGIPEALRERVFEAFFRGEPGTPPGSEGRPEPGRGLGLTVAAAVVRTHRGRLRIEPSERGAWFRISLPALE